MADSKKKNCPHQHKTRFTGGFVCEDCLTFFPRESADYRRSEYLSTLELTLGNLACQLKERDGRLELLRKKLIDCRATLKQSRYADYESLIAEVEHEIHSRGDGPDDAIVTISEDTKAL